ncbi:uncharacterized protein LOC124639305 [Helicoverpa zea]|uniref:uncharacterized protein LOC124631551 n=1 Tax=Helicoverpa zea TaxID=7113 RepID=UPI001F56910F|nr:uncharacterized protein LOC124631551 [Helicoverpa zea]XP_047030126.1 uncharacterized protein LOC124637588 [Helicoverpa zea]XP_047032539.1 uncharacterized protein LOC124639305 [Helicoverpa zea]
MANNVQFGILSTFDHNSQTWRTYKSRIGQYFVANDINKTTDASGKKRKAILLSALTEGTYKLTTDLVRPKDIENVPYEDLLSALDEHFTPKCVGFGERHNFYIAVQQAGETYSQWAARLRGLTEKCKFHNVEEALRDKFIMGMLPGREKEKIYTKDLADLTLAKVVELAENLSRGRAAAAASAGAGAGSGAAGAAPDAAAASISTATEQLYKIAQKSVSVGKVKCGVCGFSNHKSADCRFANYVCKKCHVKGHLRKMCGKVNYVVVGNGDKGESDGDDDVYAN